MVSQRRSSSEIVRFDQVGLVYPGGHHVLHDLNHVIYAGSFSFITGVSGAGKSTFLRLIFRSMIASEGSVRVFGRDVSRLTVNEIPLFRQRMGLVLSDCPLFSHLSALDNVALALKLNGSDIKKARQHARELLQWVGLENHLNDFPTTLSDGQKQRIAVARAIINRPLLLIADEPTGNLDQDSGYRLIRLFEELNKLGTTIIVATHNKAMIADFSYPELEIVHGQILTRGRGGEESYAS